MIRHAPFAPALAGSLILLALPLAAQDPADLATAHLRPGWRLEGGAHMAALDLALAPGWKTYWRAPGDAGIPPVFDWDGSRNIGAMRLHWPSPEVFDLNGMRSIGYAERLVLPIEVTPADPGQPVDLRLRVDLGICDTVCVPATLRIEGRLEGEGAQDGVIADALAARPLSPEEAGLARHGCAVEPITDGLRLTAHLDLPPLNAAPEAVVFETDDPTIWVSEAMADRAGGAVTASADLVGTSGKPFALDREGVTITLIAGPRSVQIEGCPAE
jgi:DsbC/DsbD-like thiol-disulfide interchange protein